MNARRGFLALVGGALLSGAVQRRTSAGAPTLILPPALIPVAPSRPLLDAMVADGASQMDVTLAILQRVPKVCFQDWLEDGLQRSMLFPAPDHAANNERVRAAVAVHGSIIGAIRAGAL